MTPLAVALCVAQAPNLRAQGAPAAVSPSDITLLDAGAAPRQLLRYKLVTGAREAVTLRQSTNMRMEMAGTEQPSPSLPAVLMTTELVVSDVAPDGWADIMAEIVDLDLDAEGADPAVLAAARPALALFKGVTMRYRMSPVGEVSDLTFADDAPAELRSMPSMGVTEQLGVAFPREAIGVGARWKAVRPVTQNGFTIMQDVEYVVTSLAADSMLLDMVLTQSANDQVVENNTLPPGAKITLRTLDGTGTSTVVLRFDRVQPAIAMTLRAAMVLDMQMGGESHTMNQSMVMEMVTTSTARIALPPR